MTTQPLPDVLIRPLVEMALREDLGRGGDITSMSVIPEGAKAHVVMRARKTGRIAGLALAEMAFHTVDATLKIKRLKPEGSDVSPGDEVMSVEGNARSILTGERVALNFVGHMSGIATITAGMVKAIGNHKAKLCSTRKTTPGLRALEKYAVRVGGGVNHRLGLDDAILIKDNHIAIAGSIRESVSRARASVGHMVKVEVEVDTLEQLEEALEAKADVIMLDNMTNEQMATAVRRVNGAAILEASGNVTLDRVASIAATGVDMISAGFITHSAPNFDVGLDWKMAA